MIDEKKAQAGDIVTPGDRLGVIEEFLVEENCFAEENGNVRAATVGVVNRNKRYRISVNSPKKPLLPTVGSHVLGYVIDVKKKVATIDVYYINDGTQFVECPVPFSAQLHMSNVAVRFAPSMFEVARPADWILARVIRDESPLHLACKARHLGIVSAKCVFCGAELTPLRREEMKCTNPECGKKQGRMHAAQYGLNKYKYKEK